MPEGKMLLRSRTWDRAAPTDSGPSWVRRLGVRIDGLETGPSGCTALTGVTRPRSENDPVPCLGTDFQFPVGHGFRKTASHTRIRPPRDVVKLEDRLHYLLQPPIESLLAAGSLRFPYQPFPYQLEGVAFLFARKEAVLADEMGLGKTMQAITTIRLLVKMGQIRRALLVCPKPVVTTWYREFALWAPELPVTVVAGGQTSRIWHWRRSTTGVAIANYELIVRDQQLLAATREHFDLVVIDEAQRIKNRSSATNRAVCSIPRNRSWALTGTPIENSTDDLVGIFDFVSRQLIGPQMRPRTMARAVSDHILRRTKDDVLADLPPKLIRDAVIALSPEQNDAYQRAEKDGIVRLSAMGCELTIRHVFELILRLKQICNFDPATGASSKLEQLEDDLEDCAASGRKVIVFSQWVQTLDELQRRLARFGSISYHGRIPMRYREAIIEKFRQDPRCHVMLMSYGAGSVGLNLQFASYVFLFDRWWNPAVEDQAINRAHRIGSAGPVTITRFLSAGTIEERIEQILAQKRELFTTMFGDCWRGTKLGLSQREILGLLGLERPSDLRAA
ncbi:MAG: DEAD/DEAH box helicase [Pirellulales bacterium]|nr:DEAD/DEAH box helicase [Pirellulales bacterium]